MPSELAPELEALDRRFVLASVSVAITGGDVTLETPRSADELINEIDFEKDERLPFWADVWYAWLQDGMRGTAWTTSRNYFKNAAGKIVTQWPYGAQTYRVLSRLLSRPSESTRARR